MKRNKAHRHDVTAIGLLLVFLSFWASSHLFYHNHEIGTRVIAHSHPYSSSSHSHSLSAINLISIISQSPYVGAPSFHFTWAAPPVQANLFLEVKKIWVSFRGHSRHFRAPPLRAVTSRI